MVLCLRGVELVGQPVRRLFSRYKPIWKAVVPLKGRASREANKESKKPHLPGSLMAGNEAFRQPGNLELYRDPWLCVPALQQVCFYRSQKIFLLLVKRIAGSSVTANLIDGQKLRAPCKNERWRGWRPAWGSDRGYGIVLLGHV